MNQISTSGSERRTVTAFFDASDHATQARADLIATGVPESDITLVGSDADHFAEHGDRQRGFWEKLADFFMPDDDRRAYAEGLRRGGFALSVRADSALYEKAIDVLDRDGAVDLDEREESWESEGWLRSAGGIDNVAATTAYVPPDASTAGFGGSFAGEDGIGGADAALSPTAPTGGPQISTSPAGDRTTDIVEGRAGDGDRLFGRRDLDHGRSRVRSYIVEGDDR